MHHIVGPVTWEHNVNHKSGSRERTAMPEEKDRASARVNRYQKFGKVLPCSVRQIDKLYNISQPPRSEVSVNTIW